MEEDANKKSHTTTAQAFELIDIIKPWRSILTHFSVRYQKVAQILEEHQSKKVMVAFDHLRLELKEFEHAYKFLPIFASCFTNEKEKPAQIEEESKVPEGKKKR